MSIISRSLSKIYFYRLKKKPICINLHNKLIKAFIFLWFTITILSAIIVVRTGSLFPHLEMKEEVDPLDFYWKELKEDTNQLYNYLNRMIPQLSSPIYQSVLQRDGRLLGQSLKLFVKSAQMAFQQIPFSFPFKSEWPIGSFFGVRIDPIVHKEAFHTGVDILAINSTPIYATAEGVVKKIWYAEDYGFSIKIEHSFGFSSMYSHMLSLSHLKEGDVIRKETLIGYVGSSGRSQGPHLHYEILSHDYYLNPQEYLSLLH